MEAIRKVKRVKKLAIVGASSPSGEPELQVITWRVHFHIVFSLVNQDTRINLVDLAESERQKLARVAGERIKEAKNINRLLSQLGNLINIQAMVSQSGRQRHIPYRD